MKDNYLIEKVERDCPLCDKVHFVEKRKRIGRTPGTAGRSALSWPEK